MSAVLPLWLPKTSVTRSPAYFPLMPGQRHFQTLTHDRKADLQAGRVRPLDDDLAQVGERHGCQEIKSALLAKRSEPSHASAP